MPWPDHIKSGIAARLMIEDIINVCFQRLADESIGETARYYYEMILAHALLDRANHAHGLLRDFVKKDGTGKGGGAGLDSAWDHVRDAYDKLMLPVPSQQDLSDALIGIDHGGGG